MIDATLDKINKIVPLKWRWILEHGGFRKYFKNTGWMFFGQMFSLLVSFFIGAWIARYLGPENYGLVSYVVAFVGLFSFISSLGIDFILNRELIRHPENRDELLGTGFRLKLFGGTIAFAISVFFSLFFNNDNLTRALLVIFSLSFILQAPLVINIFFQSQVRAKENFKAQLGGSVISSILKIILILSGGGVIWLIIIYTAESIWQSIFLYRAYQSLKLKIVTWHFNKILASSILKDSWPLMLSSAATFIYLRIDQVMIGALMGKEAVGIYAAGVKITEIFYFVPGVIGASLFPAIVNAKKISQHLYERRLMFFYGFLFLLSLFIVVPVALLSQPIIYFLFGSQYLESVSILRIYIWSSTGLFVSSGLTYYFMAENKTKTIFKMYFLAMLSNVILNLLLIPKYGLIGAAWATLVAYSVPLIWLYKIKKI